MESPWGGESLGWRVPRVKSPWGVILLVCDPLGRGVATVMAPGVPCGSFWGEESLERDATVVPSGSRWGGESLRCNSSGV